MIPAVLLGELDEVGAGALLGGVGPAEVQVVQAQAVVDVGDAFAVRGAGECVAFVVRACVGDEGAGLVEEVFVESSGREGVVEDAAAVEVNDARAGWRDVPVFVQEEDRHGRLWSFR